MSRQSRLAKIADDIAIEIVYDAQLLDTNELHKELLDCNYDVHEIMLIARERLIEHGFDCIAVHAGLYDNDIMQWLRHESQESLLV